jgi:hypothetical protein
MHLNGEQTSKETNCNSAKPTWQLTTKAQTTNGPLHIVEVARLVPAPSVRSPILSPCLPSFSSQERCCLCKTKRKIEIHLLCSSCSCFWWPDCIAPIDWSSNQITRHWLHAQMWHYWTYQ